MLCPIPHQSVGNFILCIFDERIVYPGTSTSMMNMNSLDSMDPLFSSYTYIHFNPSKIYKNISSSILVGCISFKKLNGKWPEKNDVVSYLENKRKH